MPAFLTLYTKGWEQIYHVVPAKLNLLPLNHSQILNKNPDITANLAVVWPVVMLMLKLSKGAVANDTKEHLSKR